MPAERPLCVRKRRRGTVRQVAKKASPNFFFGATYVDICRHDATFVDITRPEHGQMYQVMTRARWRLSLKRTSGAECSSAKSRAASHYAIRKTRLFKVNGHQMPPPWQKCCLSLPHPIELHPLRVCDAGSHLPKASERTTDDDPERFHNRARPNDNSSSDCLVDDPQFLSPPTGQH